MEDSNAHLNDMSIVKSQTKINNDELFEWSSWLISNWKFLFNNVKKISNSWEANIHSDNRADRVAFSRETN